MTRQRTANVNGTPTVRQWHFEIQYQRVSLFCLIFASVLLLAYRYCYKNSFYDRARARRARRLGKAPVYLLYYPPRLTPFVYRLLINMTCR